MKKNTFLVALITLVATTIFSSCEKEKVFVAPVANGIAFYPNPCYEGDTIIPFVTYENIGEYWYYTKQTYSINGEVVASATKPNGGGLNTHAEIKFIAPKAGTHTVIFTSQISIYTGKNNPFADGPSASSTLRVLPKEDKPTSEDTTNQ